jgi:hypothetical protein
MITLQLINADIIDDTDTVTSRTPCGPAKDSVTHYYATDHAPSVIGIKCI